MQENPDKARGVFIGQRFIQWHDGRPVGAGKIIKGIERGVYVISYSFVEPSAARLRSGTVPELLAAGFEFFDTESVWRSVFTQSYEAPTS